MYSVLSSGDRSLYLVPCSVNQAFSFSLLGMTTSSCGRGAARASGVRVRRRRGLLRCRAHAVRGPSAHALRAAPARRSAATPVARPRVARRPGHSAALPRCPNAPRALTIVGAATHLWSEICHFWLCGVLCAQKAHGRLAAFAHGVSQLRARHLQQRAHQPAACGGRQSAPPRRAPRATAPTHLVRRRHDGRAEQVAVAGGPHEQSLPGKAGRRLRLRLRDAGRRALSLGEHLPVTCRARNAVGGHRKVLR